MSISSLKIIENRIESARAESPIAVFRTDEPCNYEAVFASTVATSVRIKSGDPLLVGTFCKGSEPSLKESLAG